MLNSLANNTSDSGSFRSALLPADNNLVDQIARQPSQFNERASVMVGYKTPPVSKVKLCYVEYNTSDRFALLLVYTNLVDQIV